MENINLEKEYHIYTKIKNRDIYEDFLLSLIINTTGFVFCLTALKLFLYELPISVILLEVFLSLPVNWIMTSIMGWSKYCFYIKNKKTLLKRYSKIDVLINNMIFNFGIYKFVYELEKDLSLEEIDRINKFIKEYDTYKINKNNVATLEEYNSFFQNIEKEKIKENNKIVVINI